MISILLADDQPSVRQGLRMRLGLEPDVRVVGEANDGVEAIRMVTALHPSVVVMDVVMPSMDGLAATSVLCATAPDCAVVILSLYDDAATRTRALAAGAAAFVGKHDGTETLLAAIRQAATQPPATGSEQEHPL